MESGKLYWRLLPCPPLTGLEKIKSSTIILTCPTVCWSACTAKRFEIETDNVTVSVAPDRSDLVEVKCVNGRRMITIWVEGDITVNGIEVDV